MKQAILLMAAAILLFQSCSLPDSEIRKISFAPGIEQVKDRYQKQLEPADFEIAPGWVRFDTIIRYKVVVTLINPERLPKSDEELKALALNLSADVYDQVVNKDDFSEVEVIFRGMSGLLLKMKVRRNYLFAVEEIQQFRSGENGLRR